MSYHENEKENNVIVGDLDRFWIDMIDGGLWRATRTTQIAA